MMSKAIFGLVPVIICGFFIRRNSCCEKEDYCYDNSLGHWLFYNHLNCRMGSTCTDRNIVHRRRYHSLAVNCEREDYCTNIFPLHLLTHTHTRCRGGAGCVDTDLSHRIIYHFNI